jgi:hypothetical protein
MHIRTYTKQLFISVAALSVLSYCEPVDIQIGVALLPGARDKFVLHFSSQEAAKRAADYLETAVIDAYSESETSSLSSTPASSFSTAKRY